MPDKKKVNKYTQIALYVLQFLPSLLHIAVILYCVFVLHMASSNQQTHSVTGPRVDSSIPTAASSPYIVI